MSLPIVVQTATRQSRSQIKATWQAIAKVILYKSCCELLLVCLFVTEPQAQYFYSFKASYEASYEASQMFSFRTQCIENKTVLKCTRKVPKNQSYLDILTLSVKYTVNKENILMGNIQL